MGSGITADRSGADDRYLLLRHYVFSHIRFAARLAAHSAADPSTSGAAVDRCPDPNPSWGGEQTLQTAFLNEARPDCRYVRLAIAKRVRRGRAEYELGIAQRFKFDPFARRLESREVPMPQFVRRRQDARCDGDPEDGVARRGL